MLKKFLSLLKVYRGQIISMIVMSVLAIGVFVGFSVEWHTIKTITENQFDINNFPDYQVVISNGVKNSDVNFLNEFEEIDYNLEKDIVTDALDFESTNVAITLLSEYTINTFSIVNGKKYDDTSYGIWLNDKFMKKNGLKIGDSINLIYAYKEFSLEILGSIKASNYYIPIDSSGTKIMPDFKTYGYSYISESTYKTMLMTDDISYDIININSNKTLSEIETIVSKNINNNIKINEKKDNLGYSEAYGEVDEGKLCANLISVVLGIIVLLSLFTLFERISKKERIEIAIFKALGFKNRQIGLVYSSIGIFVGVISGIFGILIGYFIGYYFMNSNGLMATYIDPISWKLSYPKYIFAFILLYIIFLGAISYLLIRLPLKEKTCNLFRRQTPKKYKPIFFEKFKFFDKLSFTTRWNLRDVFRHKLRTSLQIFGIFSSMVLLFYTFGMKDTINKLIDKYEDSYNYTTKINLVSNAKNDEIDELAKTLEADGSATSYVLIDESYYQMNIYSNNYNHIKLLNKKLNLISIQDEGVYICYRMYQKGYKVGDVIDVMVGRDTYKMSIAGVYRTMGSEGICFSTTYAKKIGLEYKFDSLYTNYSSKDINSSIVLQSETKESIINSLKEMMKVLDQMIILVIFVSVVIGFVVLYTISSMSFIERYHDFSTLKVLGFKNKELKKISFKLNFYLTIIGIIISIPLSYVILKVVFQKLGSEYEMEAVPGILTYLTSILITFFVSILVGQFVFRKNKDIQMVEALKECE